MTVLQRIPVTGERPYDVVIGSDVFGEIAPLLDGAAKVAIIRPAVLAETAETVAALLAAAGIEAHPIEVPDSEEQKTLTVAGACFDELARLGMTRTDAVVGLGGGATTDLAGWVAASWLRGVRVVQVPTTLAGMVDAAVGGKTGINIARGKNLVGAFYPPAGVVCDLQTLLTMPPSDYVAGLGEVIKCGFIADPVILELVESDPAAVATPGNRFELELVERSVRVKADVVSNDLTEQGRREILNYGHTLGHAIEKAERFRWRHGAAVSVGMVFAAEVAHATGRLDQVTTERHRQVLASVGLPTGYRRGVFDSLLETMRLDKKSRGNQLRFVLLDGLARPVTVQGPDVAVLAAAYEKVSHD